MMPVIFLEEEHTRLKSYTASTKGAVSIVRVDIEVTDPMRLGYLLAELETIEKAQKARQTTEKAAARAKTRAKPQLALAAPLLRLAHRTEGE
ncbi:hypothetical protein [Pararhizobium gei]|uniref:hypothetical protein n=1 Tax=Pararhizobium gei TaxID=1395951 RepID=UPI0023DA2593|nr:hypothetical protein [Rhizobium gei]